MENNEWEVSSVRRVDRVWETPVLEIIAHRMRDDFGADEVVIKIDFYHVQSALSMIKDWREQ